MKYGIFIPTTDYNNFIVKLIYISPCLNTWALFRCTAKCICFVDNCEYQSLDFVVYNKKL